MDKLTATLAAFIGAILIFALSKLIEFIWNKIQQDRKKYLSRTELIEFLNLKKESYGVDRIRLVENPSDTIEVVRIELRPAVSDIQINKLFNLLHHNYFAYTIQCGIDMEGPIIFFTIW